MSDQNYQLYEYALHNKGIVAKYIVDDTPPQTYLNLASCESRQENAISTRLGSMLITPPLPPAPVITDINTFVPGGFESHTVPLMTQHGSAPADWHITIIGTGFGALQGASTISFGGIDVATYISWSDTSLVCVVIGAPGPASIIVTVGGFNSNTWPFLITQIIIMI